MVLPQFLHLWICRERISLSDIFTAEGNSVKGRVSCFNIARHLRALEMTGAKRTSRQNCQKRWTLDAPLFRALLGSSIHPNCIVTNFFRGNDHIWRTVKTNSNDMWWFTSQDILVERTDAPASAIQTSPFQWLTWKNEFTTQKILI